MNSHPELCHASEWRSVLSRSTSPSSTSTPGFVHSYVARSALMGQSSPDAGGPNARYQTRNGSGADDTPRDALMSQVDYKIWLSWRGPCSGATSPSAHLSDASTLCGVRNEGDASDTACPGTTGDTPFQDLTLRDIESLEELPGCSGRRKSGAYRLDRRHAIKVSPHPSLLYEARMLAHIRRHFARVPVPAVYGTRCLRDGLGRITHYCMLLEYVDGIRAEEAVNDWSPEETRLFMSEVQMLRDSLSSMRGPRIQAVDGGPEAWDRHVQDELFDYMGRDMERGPFDTEAGFTAAVGEALRRRGAETARRPLVCRLVDQLATAAAAASSEHHHHHQPPFPFQHANLTLGNILVRRTGHASAPEIVGVLGWGQSGFYPPWWELAKMAASEDRLVVDMVAADAAFAWYSHQVSVMMHVRDMIY